MKIIKGEGLVSKQRCPLICIF